MSDEYTTLADFYDDIYAFRTQDVDFYVAKVGEQPGPILEVGCGTGRVTLPLLATGEEIYGVDASPAMLRILRYKLADRPELLPRFSEGDMRHFDLGRKFQQVFVPFRAFLHVDTVDEQLATLRNFAKHLLADGRLILDIFAPSYRLMSQEQRRATLPAQHLADGRVVTVADHVTYVHREQRLNVERHIDTVLPDGILRRRVEHFHLRYVFRYEMELLLRQAGFAVETVYGDFTGRPYDYHSGEMIFVARLV